MKKLGEAGGIVVGDTVRCVSPDHQGENPFKVFSIWEFTGGDVRVYTTDGEQSHTVQNKTGCLLGDLVRVEEGEKGGEGMKELKEWKGIKIGSVVKCKAEGHKGPNPFKVTKVGDYGDWILAYGSAEGVTCKGKKGHKFYNACDVEELELLDGVIGEGKIGVGDTVMCGDPTHKGPNPFVVELMSRGGEGLWYTGEQTHGLGDISACMVDKCTIMKKGENKGKIEIGDWVWCENETHEGQNPFKVTAKNGNKWVQGVEHKAEHHSGYGDVKWCSVKQCVKVEVGGEIGVGDWVSCTDPLHRGPERFQVIKVEDVGSGYGLAYSGESADNHKCGPMEWYSACDVSTLIKLPIKSTEITEMEVPFKTQQMVRTQKAKGLFTLKSNGFGFPVPDFRITDNEEGIKREWGGGHGGEVVRFARPCPLTPRHGFVDSRMVTSKEEAGKVLREALEADSKAELILMPVIECEASAIWTPGQLTIGPGNDGATAGHGAKVMEVTGDLTDSHLLGLAGVKESPYMEFVYGSPRGSGAGKYTYLVQLRDGPKLPIGVKDFVPQEVRVERVVSIPERIEERPDLLAWEEQVKTFQPGTVVYHPGGGLADHYSVHCIQLWAFHKITVPIPVLTTRCPKVGEVLEKVTAPIPEPDASEMVRGFKLAVTRQFPEGPEGKGKFMASSWAMLAGVHNLAVWMGKYDRLVGYGMGMAYRLCHTACMGELRHKFSEQVGHGSRDSIYQKFFNRTLPQRERMQDAIGMFYSDVWPGGYGGPKWGEFAWVGLRMYNKIAENDYQGAVEEYNKLINMAHNNGWAFNKFCTTEEMNRSAKAGAYPVLQAMNLYLELLSNTRRFNVGRWEKLGEPLRVERVEKITPVKVQVTIAEKSMWAQVGWSAGERTKRYQVGVVSDKAMEMVGEKIKAHETVGSMATNSDTQYVVLENDGGWVWGVQWKDVWEPVLVVEPKKEVTVEEMVFPGGKVWKGKIKEETVVVTPSVPVVKKKKVYKKKKVVVVLDTVEKKPVTGLKEWGGFKVGDVVKCKHEGHKYPNPFTIHTFSSLIAYSEESWNNQSLLHEPGGYAGCQIEDLDKVDPPVIEIGDTVKCLNPHHQSENPFVVKGKFNSYLGDVVYAVEGGEKIDPSKFPYKLHSNYNGLDQTIGCKVSECQIVKKKDEADIDLLSELWKGMHSAATKDQLVKDFKDGKIEVGSVVWCTNPSHTGPNPFKVTQKSYLSVYSEETQYANQHSGTPPSEWPQLKKHTIAGGQSTWGCKIKEVKLYEKPFAKSDSGWAEGKKKGESDE